MRPDQPRPSRPAPPDIAELRELRAAHPELAPAIDLQIDLVESQRRMQARVPTPVVPLTASMAAERLSGGHRLLELSEVSLDWSDFRLAIRQTADILRRHESLDADDHTRIVELAREATTIEAQLTAWYSESSVPPGQRVVGSARENLPAALDQVFTIAIRPFLARAVDVASQGVRLEAWHQPWCPFCGAEAEFAILTAEGARLLTCGRCEGRWPWDEVGCTGCETRDPSQLVTFTSPDRRYRIYACNKCRRYLKAYDSRGARRPALPIVDTIATLPLDAAAIQQGYGN
jgi:formate dehydrogenase maturation protein FdhE